MRLSAWISLAAATLAAAIPLSTGCTQDFGQFEPQPGAGCGDSEKSCGGNCVSRIDPTFGCGDGCEPCNIPGAIAVCSAGACAVGECVAGFSDCDMAPATGCEVETASSEQHCGQCNNACDPGQECVGGACVGCETGQADCDGDTGNGCETPLGTDTDCASCGDACVYENATGACQAGACALTSCDPGWGDCDADTATGCEIDVENDPAHCGDCANACPSGPNSTATCQDGACGLECMGTFADCDLDPANGCEVDLATDVAHCGGCGRACDTTNVVTAMCAAGLCTSTCMDGFGNCETPPAPGADDGCETDTETSVDHCGACGRACATTNVASLSCAAGVCDSTCDLGYGNCSQPAAGADNGCETNVLMNDDNCGGCGNTCGAQGNDFECDGGPNGVQQICGCNQNNECDTDGGGPAMGNCGGTGLCTCGGTTCSPGEGCAHDGTTSVCSCNGGAGCGAGMTCCDDPTGCFNLMTDPQSCGACGRACPAGFACANGGCVCDEDADCDAGSGGTIDCNGMGRCVCGGNTCAPGERCQPDGTCG